MQEQEVLKLVAEYEEAKRAAFDKMLEKIANKLIKPHRGEGDQAMIDAAYSAASVIEQQGADDYGDHEEIAEQILGSFE